MGKILIIKGADFEENAVAKVSTPKMIFDAQLSHAELLVNVLLQSNASFTSVPDKNRSTIVVHEKYCIETAPKASYQSKNIMTIPRGAKTITIKVTDTRLLFGLGIFDHAGASLFDSGWIAASTTNTFTKDISAFCQDTSVFFCSNVAPNPKTFTNFFDGSETKESIGWSCEVTF